MKVLQIVQNISWKHISNKYLYGTLPRIPKKQKQGRLVYVIRHEEAASRVLLWNPAKKQEGHVSH